MDITEAVTEPLTEYGEQGSIEDKMTTQQQNWFKVNGSYYAIPHYEGYYGMFYDVDTFDERNLFMTDSGTFTNYSGRGKGVDGVAGTYDDGLPATYEEFLEEKQKIIESGVSRDNEEYEYGLYCMSVPLHNHLGPMDATLGVTGPKARIIMKGVDDIEARLKDIAAVISEKLIKIKYIPEY